MATTQVKINVPGNHLMVGLLGQRDELLRLVETAFPNSTVHVRGNEITVDGEGAEQVGRLCCSRATRSSRPRSTAPSTW
jgi:phosphate starvation-inducible PhoH-like protein